MSFHVNPETGKTGTCRAGSPDKCRFRTDDNPDVPHYATEDEAKAASEKLMKNKYEIKAASIKKPRQADLEKRANNAWKANEEEQKAIAEDLANYATDATLLKVGTAGLKMNSEQLQKIWSRTKNDRVREDVEYNENFKFPVNEETFNHVVSNKVLALKHGADFIEDSSINASKKEKMMTQILGSQNKKSLNLLREDSPLRLGDKKTMITHLDKMYFDENLVKSFGKDTEQLETVMNDRQRVGVAQYTDNKKVIDTIAEEIPSNTKNLEQIEQAIAILKNPNRTGTAEKIVMDKVPEAKSYNKITELEEEGKLDVDEFVPNGQPNPRKRGEYIYTLDKKKVEELELSPKDIDVMIRHKKGTNLYSASYDPRTGEYRGFID